MAQAKNAKAARPVPKRTIGVRGMKHQHHYGNASDVALRDAGQIRTLITNLDRVVQILACDVAAAEEEHEGSDRSKTAYPILARTLAARRDNLRNTIATLDQRLANLAAELVPELQA
jgi:hypothetical protein